MRMRGGSAAAWGAVARVRPWVAVLAMGAGPAAAQSADPAGTLDDVVVSASRSAQRAFDAPAAVQSVDGESVRAAGPGFDPSEALARVPGLVVQDRQNLAQDPQVSIRGFGARSTFGVRGLRLIVDGIPATMPDGQGQLSTVPLTAIDRIEVLRGPLAQLYGNAAGGVVQVFTREGESPPRAGGEFFAGSFGTLRGALSGSTRADGFAGRVDATTFRTDGWRAWSEATRRQLDARLDWTLPTGTRVGVVAGAFDQPLARDPGGLTRAQLDADPRQASPASVAQQAAKTVSQQQLGLRVEHAIDADRRFAVRLYGGQRDLDQALAVPLAAQIAPTSSGGWVGLDRDYAGLGLQWSQRTRLGSTLLEWTAGLDVDAMRERRRGWINSGGVRGDLKRDEDNRVSSTDAYVQAAWRLAESWSVIAGARTSRVRFTTEDRYVRTGNPDDSGQADYSATNPVAGVVWHASDTLNVYANLGRGFETPTFAELAYRPVGSGLNFGLAAARSRHAELGAKWQTPTGGRLDLAVFDVRTEDEIVVASNTGGRAVFRNAGRTQRRGLELAWTERIGREWRMQLALTALDATFLDASGRGPTAIAAGNALPGAPPRRAFAELAWQPSADRGPFAAAALVHGGRVYVDDANTDSAAAWTVVHLRAGLRQRMGRWRFSQVLHVENAGGRNYVGSVIVNESNQRYFESAPTRTWAFGVTAAYVFD
ncbi:MAG: TonB-dependent receptor [Burkholderiales bacterium]|jgi:iron complex outermembrane receptor protein